MRHFERANILLFVVKRKFIPLFLFKCAINHAVTFAAGALAARLPPVVNLLPVTFVLLPFV